MSNSAAAAGTGERPSRDVQLSTCDNCGRNFATDRIDTHFNICVNQRERKPFNIAQKRVEGTEAEDMIKTGKAYNYKFPTIEI
jgi:hypothetical protein